MCDRWPQLMTARTAGEYLDASVSTLKREVSAGRIKARMMRGEPRYSRDDLDSYIESLEPGRGECAANLVREAREQAERAAKRLAKQAKRTQQTEQVA